MDLSVTAPHHFISVSLFPLHQWLAMFPALIFDHTLYLRLDKRKIFARSYELSSYMLWQNSGFVLLLSKNTQQNFCDGGTSDSYIS